MTGPEKDNHGPREAFTAQVRKALADPVLQAALDGNAERRINAIDEAFASVPEGRLALRQRAHRMKARVVAQLPEMLEQFMDNARRNGMIIHRAADADQAVEIVLDIARRHRAHLAAKSKSMVSEEIHLNPALEAAGIRPVETDLGEYIVQLRGEPPAHIITPAVHLTRREVGQLFAEKLGIPFTEDIPILTATARKVLRQTFLEAEIGLSGVNAGVVETGTLCLVTNEGNGRMCTTIPPVHIAIMGIERLVPTLDDLALVLRILPRSATGQKISVYTSLIHGPRRSGARETADADGPLERHLVLVDNGRSRLVGSPLEEALYCIRCGACLNACPVFREIGGHSYRGLDGRISPYPGPIGSVISPGLFGYETFGHLARVSSLCGACKDACPVDIDLPKLLLRVRAGMEPAAVLPKAPAGPGDPASPAQLTDPKTSKRHAPWGLKVFLSIFSWFAARPGRFHMAQRIASVFSRLVGRAGWLRLPAFTGWGLSRDFPIFVGKTFRDRFKELETAPASLRPVPGPPRQSTSPHTPDGAWHPVAPAAPQIEASQSNIEILDERFTGELTALGGKIVHCQADQLGDAILAYLKEYGITSIQAWNASNLSPALEPALRQAGIVLSEQADPELEAGLTGAVAGIAETGSLVITSGPGQPLSASLLPRRHLAVLHKADILPDLEAALALPALRRASSAVLISGPSRTADIEMTLTIGVHGPGELIVFIVS